MDVALGTQHKDLNSPDATAICSALGPEGFAVLDTVRAAVHSRRQAKGEGAPWRVLEAGTSLAARVLREYRTTPSLFAFGAAVARELLPRNAAALDFGTSGMSGGGSKSLVDRLEKALKEQAIGKKAESGVAKLKDKKKRHETFLDKVTCMALCDAQACGHKKGGRRKRCGNTVGEDVLGDMVGDDGTALRPGDIHYKTSAGLHVDTKLFRDPSVVSKLFSFGKSVAWKFLGGNAQDQYFGIGPWASKHLVKDWRDIDDGVMHICHYHADILRKKNRSYWLVAATVALGKVMIVLTAAAIAEQIRTNEAVRDALADGKLTGAEIRNINNHLKHMDPNSARFKSLQSQLEGAKYKSTGKSTGKARANDSIVVQSGKILSARKARKVHDAQREAQHGAQTQSVRTGDNEVDELRARMGELMREDRTLNSSQAAELATKKIAEENAAKKVTKKVTKKATTVAAKKAKAVKPGSIKPLRLEPVDLATPKRNPQNVVEHPMPDGSSIIFLDEDTTPKPRRIDKGPDDGTARAYAPYVVDRDTLSMTSPIYTDLARNLFLESNEVSPDLTNLFLESDKVTRVGEQPSRLF